MEDNIRAPIEYKYEQLVEPGRRPRGRPRTRASIKEDNEITEDILNIDIENALRQSRIEYEQKCREEEERRENRIELLSKFKNILHQLKRIGAYDKDIQNLNLLLVPIIEQYCETLGQTVSIDKETYDMIVKNIRSIRLKPEETELVLGMIYSEN